MTPGETARVLAKAAAFDQRTIGESDVLAWHEALADLNGADALNAITQHYATSDQRIMPVHVRRLATDIRRERHRIERETDEQRAIESYRAQAGPLADRSAEIQAFVGQVREVLPEGDREALRPRTVAWEREHRAYERAANAEPNPDYDPGMAPVAEWCAGKGEPAGEWWQDDTARERHAQTLLAEAGRLRPKAGETA